jgi:hypothetical protein
MSFSDVATAISVGTASAMAVGVAAAGSPGLAALGEIAAVSGMADRSAMLLRTTPRRCKVCRHLAYRLIRWTGLI